MESRNIMASFRVSSGFEDFLELELLEGVRARCGTRVGGSQDFSNLQFQIRNEDLIAIFETLVRVTLR